MNTPEFYSVVETIPYQYRHPRMLHALIRWLNIKTAIEIGTHIGYAACWMARGCRWRRVSRACRTE